MCSEGIALTQEERFRIIRDIARWKTELHINDCIDNEYYRNYLSSVAECSDTAIKNWWLTSVGEWLASRQDLTIPDDKVFGEWLEIQFQHLKSGDEIDYGYVVAVSDATIRKAQESTGS